MVCSKAFVFLGVRPSLGTKMKVICQGKGQISRSQIKKKAFAGAFVFTNTSCSVTCTLCFAVCKCFQFGPVYNFVVW